MDSLKLIDNELVPVYVTDKGIKVVDGRELHTVLQSKQDFSSWVKKRLNECDAVKNLDYELHHNSVEQVSGTKHRIDYTILLATAKEMAMLERNAKGKQVRRYFIGVEEKYKEQQTPPQTLQSQIRTIAQGTDELYQRVDTLEERFTKFEDELPVSGADMDDIQSAVKKKGVQVMGGKESNAYQDKSTRTYVYADIQCELRRQFGVKRYKEIKHKDAPDAVRIIENYQLPIVLKNRVDMANAQQSLPLEGGAQS